MKFPKLGLMTIAALAIAMPAFADHHEGKGMKKGGYFSKLDENNDGSISRAEFDAMHAKKFEKMDADNNGSVSQGEWTAMKEKWHEKRKEMKQKWKEKKEAMESEE